MASGEQNCMGWLEGELDRLRGDGLLRSPRVRTSRQGPEIEIDGRRLANFGSNDYLDLSAHPQVAEAALAAIDNGGWGAGASPLINGRSALHAELEQAVADFEQCDAALLFSSGFAANVGAITALVGRGDAVFADAKNHASLIDGCRLSCADVHVYDHLDCDHLARLLTESATARRRMIVTDSLFSMDGDLAPLDQIAELRDRFGCMLLIDEAHATGVFGEGGRGAAEYLGVEDQIDVKVGTLSKALGCAGGFVCGRRKLIDWLFNRARPYAFSTAHPDAGAAAALAALQIMKDEPNRRRELLSRTAALRGRLTANGWDIGASVSQIIPIHIGDADGTMQLSEYLADAGLFVPGIRPPSVPDGESLLRLSLSFGHTDEMIDKLVEALAAFNRRST
jgi:8-amino-7-oxononanoate synthase